MSTRYPVIDHTLGGWTVTLHRTPTCFQWGPYPTQIEAEAQAAYVMGHLDEFNKPGDGPEAPEGTQPGLELGE
jgi:hypothetical protein